MATTPDSASARSAILREALRHAAVSGINNIKIEQVLKDAHASSSSLYHHFKSRAGLLEAVRNERERLGLLEEDPALLELLDSITTNDEFCDYMTGQLRRAVTDPEAIRRRETRLDALTQPGTDRPTDVLMNMLIDHTSAFVQSAIDRRLCNSCLDARAYAVVFMSLSLGQLATRNLLDTEQWLITATEAAIAPLRC